MLTLFAQCTNAWAGFHSSGGWIGFLAVALSMVAVTRRITFFTVRQSVETEEAWEGDPTAAYLAPLMALLAIILITDAFSSGFEVLPGSRAGNRSRDLFLLGQQVDTAPFGGHLVRQRHRDWHGGLHCLAGAGRISGNAEQVPSFLVHWQSLPDWRPPG